MRVISAGLVFAAMSVMASLGATTTHAQDLTEFQQPFYNAHKCLRLRVANQSGARTILARNLCNAQVAALVCFRILKENDSVRRTGWHCEFSDRYGPNVERTVSRGGVYHKTLKAAACSKSKDLCIQVVRSIELKVNETRADPEPIGRDLRGRFGLLN